MTNFRSGFACIVGRPNVGKSTLINLMVGEKISIISKQPQTTRHTIRGIVHKNDGQIVLVDTPGIHKPKTLLGSRLNELVKQTWSEVDVVVFCVPADQKIGPGDRFIVQEINEQIRKPKIGVLTKIDLVNPNLIVERLIELEKVSKDFGFDWDEIIPISSESEENVDKLSNLIIKYLPEGPELYPSEIFTEEPIETLVAEFIREAALEDLREELPHSLAVTVEKIENAEDRPIDKPLMKIFANIYVERESQKGIIIGQKGSKLKEIGSLARKQIETLVGTKVYLDLQVKVAPDWQTDLKELTKLGF
mgnify:FL=1